MSGRLFLIPAKLHHRPGGVAHGVIKLQKKEVYPMKEFALAVLKAAFMLLLAGVLFAPIAL